MYNSFPVCRSILDHWIYKDCEYLKVWLTMLARSRYLKDPKEGIYEKIVYKIYYGEFIFGYKSWSGNLGISYQRLRGLIKKLIDSNMIILKIQTSKFSIYEIVNYEKYNSQISIENEQFEDSGNSQITVRQQPSNTQVTTNKESIRRYKKDKNTFLLDSIEIQLAEILYEYIISNNSSYKEPNFQKWAKGFDLIIRIDKKDIEEVKEVIAFSQTDSFWMTNILSPDKLRKQYNQLIMKMKLAHTPQNTKGNQVTSKCRTV